MPRGANAGNLSLYYPFSQIRRYGFFGLVTFLVRSEANPASLVRAMERVVSEVNRDIWVRASETVVDTRWRITEELRFYTWFLGVFACTALVLAAVGVFGVMSYQVSRRTHEIGIRTALGADPRDVLVLILRNALFMTSVGLTIGLRSALARFLESRLVELNAREVKSTDPATSALCDTSRKASGLRCLPAILPRRSEHRAPRRGRDAMSERRGSHPV